MNNKHFLCFHPRIIVIMISIVGPPTALLSLQRPRWTLFLGPSGGALPPSLHSDGLDANNDDNCMLIFHLALLFFSSACCVLTWWVTQRNINSKKMWHKSQQIIFTLIQYVTFVCTGNHTFDLSCLLVKWANNNVLTTSGLPSINSQNSYSFHSLTILI